jgi:hypothetical protein
VAKAEHNDESGVLTTDQDLRLQDKIKIKEQIIKSKPYNKNEALEFWRRQRL